MFLIVGLGNPEDKYSGTRHNLGFVVLDELRRKLNLPDWPKEDKFKAEVLKLSDELILARPQTYMNRSGLAVSALVNFYKIDSEGIIVVHDELDLSLGHIKIRLGGAAAGHHGVESIIESLGTDKFVRVRLGIGTQKALLGEHKKTSFNAEHFVLDPFDSKETSAVKRLHKQAVKAIEILLKDGLEKAQNQFN